MIVYYVSVCSVSTFSVMYKMHSVGAWLSNSFPRDIFFITWSFEGARPWRDGTAFGLDYRFRTLFKLINEV